VQGSCASLTPFEVNAATQHLDLRLGWNSAGDKFGIAAYVTNALDEQYVTGINNLTTGIFGTPFASISEPRMWGVEATVRF
jgi:iron complex outermembrane receptor protein